MGVPAGVVRLVAMFSLAFIVYLVIIYIRTSKMGFGF